MAEISPALVKELREKTGAGMMDCKNALKETKGDMEGAIDWLRKKGLSSAAKKSGRVTAEGLISVFCQGNKGAMVEINAETDFVGRNDIFQKFAKHVAECAINVKGDLERLKKEPYPSSTKTVEDVLTQLIATIGENMSLRRAAYFEVPEGVVTSYIHNAVAPGLGRLGVLVALTSKASPQLLEELGKKIAMHAAAAQPIALTIDTVDSSEIEREKAIFREQALASGKPVDVVDKMVEGRLRKFYEEAVLEEQIFVMDGKTRIKDVVASTAKELNHFIQLTDFARFGLGEGIEKVTSDFAAEVATQLEKK